MADEEHGETGESTAPDAETVEVADELRADPEPSAAEDGPAEEIVPENVGEEEKVEEETAVPEDVPPEYTGDEEEQEETVMPEDAPPETVDEPQPEAVGADESGAVQPEPESGEQPVAEAGTPEDDMQPQQLDSTEAEVVVPAVTDEEPVTAESAEPREDEGLLEAVEDGKDTVIGRPSQAEDDGMGGDDLDVQQSGDQLADEPSEVMPYPSADDVDVLGEEAAELVSPEPEHDELAVFDEGDEPDPTRMTDRVGPVHECPDLPTPPPLLVEGRDDIETPTDESAVPSVLVCFSESFLFELVLY